MSIAVLLDHSPWIYIDEKKNLLFTTASANPDYNEEVEREKARIWQEEWMRERGSKCAPPYEHGERKYLISQKMIPLHYPYSVEDIANALRDIVYAWDNYPPYLDKVRDAIEIYENTRNFKKASYGKKLLNVSWSSYTGKKEVVLSLPCKTPRMWMGIETIVLPIDADWIDFARVIKEFVEADATTYSRFKTYKRMLNLTPPKPRGKKKDTSGKE